MALPFNNKHFIQWTLLGVLIVFAATYFNSRKNSEARRQLYDLPEPLPVISNVSSFSLTNHLGHQMTETDFLDKPWLANIIFTRCPTVCPQITRKISEVLQKLPPDINLVTLTTDPEFDKPKVLYNFAKANRAIATNWFYLTGDKKTINKLAINDLKMVSVLKKEDEMESPTDLFIHSSLLVLVDQYGRVRTSFETDSEELLSDIQAAIKKLD